MQYVRLGNTGLLVSRLCFGTLTIGPLQANLPLQEGVAVLRHALDSGINFIDTAKSYGTYRYIREALRYSKNKVIVATKSYDYTYTGMHQSVVEALEEMGLEYIDIFLLHEQESRLTLQGHRPALEYLLEAKEKGIVRAVGISSHSVEAVRAAAAMPEIDVIHPLVNQAGIGIRGGNLDDMLEAIKEAYRQGKGVYGMKALGGGHLISQVEEALKFAFSLPWVHSFAVGMQSIAEVEFNLALLEGRKPPPEVLRHLGGRRRFLHIEEWCQGCGSCVERCPWEALEIVNGRAQVDPGICVLCGYCGAVCPEFCIKVI
ncbi:aldo/keto reductase [Calderihabitans maritimus]|uniref:Predicted oxidoreductase of the aldo/keto reductase family n=1 Tax=Calderihabitans maritimus TaxID=1246530 RepID=A0A1Z5HT19_9FIRM|nr:aldo/keto reductase [Calderihabitans maritimus]GAW92664.1 predicted oxidoreductase of the aldo/keto reductase family [Calderihabitans maritimus]